MLMQYNILSKYWFSESTLLKISETFGNLGMEDRAAATMIMMKSV